MAKCVEHGGSVEYGNADMLERLRADRTRFGAVICSRVLCTISGLHRVGLRVVGPAPPGRG